MPLFSVMLEWIATQVDQSGDQQCNGRGGCIGNGQYRGGKGQLPLHIQPGRGNGRDEMITVDQAVMDEVRGPLHKGPVGGPGGAEGVHLNLFRPVAPQPFAQQQCDGAAETVTADDDALLGTMESLQIAVDKLSGAEEGVMKPS